MKITSPKFCIGYNDRLWRTRNWGLTPNPHAAHFWRSEAAARRAERRAINPDAYFTAPSAALWLLGALAWCAVVAILCVPAWRMAVWEAITR